MLKWPARAAASLRVLFAPLQEVDIYVEDEGDEAFYTNLFKRIGGTEVPVSRVFALTGRQSVLEAARSHDFARRRALFIVDGDLEWVAGSPPPRGPGVFRFNAYCVENLIICERAICRILMEDAVLSQERASGEFAFRDWIDEVENSLIPLFVAFAAGYVHQSQEKTVSIGVAAICDFDRRNVFLRINREKIREVIRRTLEACQDVSGEDFSDTYDGIFANIVSLPVLHRAISGKDFLLPLLHFRIMSFGCRMTRAALRSRLSLNCEIAAFSDVQQALRRAALA